MKLWHLRPIDDLVDNPWYPWYDKAFGFVIRAETEEEARSLAQANGGDETRGDSWLERVAIWTNPQYVTCTELLAESEGGEEIIMRDFASA